MRNDDKLPVKKEDKEIEIICNSVDLGGMANTLHIAAKALLDKEVSAVSLNAACNAAQQISHLIRTHLEAQRIRARLRALKS